mmetsp:Transcript_28266/g.68783  ORF Transcript_28266/g.68783 Transcript_28266/m.68783 type:complete len:1112 (-) Transcript_28266:645-3980(-)
MADSSEDDKLQYVKQEYFHQVPRRWFGSHGPDDKSTGDDSGNLFMSEPSTSEADSSELHGGIRSPFASIDSGDPDCLPPAPLPSARLLDAAPHSPGNTSLSSWESRHLGDRQVHIDFAPRRKGETEPSSEHQSGDNQIQNRSDAVPPASSGPQEEAVDERKQQQSFGAKRTSNGELGTHEMNQSWETHPQHLETSGGNTPIQENTSELVAMLSVPTLSANLLHANPADTSVNMVLSASEGESFEGNAILNNYDSSDWFFGDESPSPILSNPKTTPQTKLKGDRHRRTRSGKQGSGSHRRQRSGDTAAVVLSTGSTEWKGMEQDNIPLPSELVSYNEFIDHEDSFEAEGDNRQKNNRSVPPVENGSDAAKNSEVRSDLVGEANQSSRFSLGQTGQQKARRQSRRFRRDSRARKRYSSHEYDDSSNISMSPQQFQDRPFIIDMQDRAASISNFYTQSPGAAVNKRSSIHDTPSSASNFSGYYPGSERIDNRRHSYSFSREFHEQGFRFGRGESPANPAVPPWWNSPIPITDSRKSFPSVRDHSPRSDPRSDSGTSGFGPSDCGGDTPHSRHRKSLDPQWEQVVNNDSDSESSAGLRAVRFQSPMLQPGLSPFANIGKKKVERADRRSFLPQISAAASEKSHSTFICPSCKTRQREFFTVSSAPRQFESPSGYIALYFAIYVVAALYIFGLQEGWGRLDCFYFAVITLTTAGLGDFVPTSDSAKVMCSIFIYFGVACIGLLLGSYIAGMLDESSSRLARANRIKACPNCTRIQNIKDAAEHRAKEYRKSVRAMRRDSLFQARNFQSEHPLVEPTTKKAKHGHLNFRRGSDAGPLVRPSIFETTEPRSSEQYKISPKGDSGENRSPKNCESVSSSPLQADLSAKEVLLDANKEVAGSPGTTAILGRQSHTRHSSLDIGNSKLAFALRGIPEAPRRSNVSTQASQPTLNGIGDKRMPSPPAHTSWGEKAFHNYASDGDFSDSEESIASEESNGNDIGLEEKYSSVKNAKYVFLTLREALINSMVIIAFGCMGFYFIEGFSFVDSWYFTTVLLTTVGYGDIVPHTKGGKLFATVYILVAGTILLNNMSMISMIPLELRRRRTEMAVLNQVCSRQAHC